MLENKGFSYCTSVDELAERYNVLPDPVLSFVNVSCELDEYASTEKDVLYDAVEQLMLIFPSFLYVKIGKYCHFSIYPRSF